MLIRLSTWERIRTRFSEDEKAQLRKAVQGEAICPRGVMLDEERLPEELRAKIKGAVREGRG